METYLDYNGFENGVLHYMGESASFPANASKDEVYKVNGEMYLYNGTSWLKWSANCGTRYDATKDSVAEGYNSNNAASGNYSHAEGQSTTASGTASHTEGSGTVAQNQSEHAEGSFNKSNKASDTYGNAGNTQHSIGIGPNSNTRKNAFEVMQNGDAYLLGVGGYDGTNPGSATTVQASIATGGVTYGSGTNIDIDSNNDINAVGYRYDDVADSFAVGSNSVAAGQGSFACGTGQAQGDYSYSEGFWTSSVGDHSHSEGNHSIAAGEDSHAEGYWTTAAGDGSHTEGFGIAPTFKVGSWNDDGRIITLLGTIPPIGSIVYCGSGDFWRKVVDTTATTITVDLSMGLAKTDEPLMIYEGGVAYGEYSHSEGEKTRALNKSSHTEGTYTVALNESEHADGRFNVSHKATTDEAWRSNPGNTQHSIGVGDNANARKNAFETMTNGDVYVYGVGGYQGTDTKVQDASIKTLQDTMTGLAMPIGSVQMYVGNADPSGWLLCDGRCIPVTSQSDLTVGSGYEEYQELVNVIGTKYGFSQAGSSVSVKNTTISGNRVLIPDFRRRFPLGAQGTGAADDAWSCGSSTYHTRLGQDGGAKEVTLTVNEMPNHSHAVGMSDGTGSPATYADDASQSSTVHYETTTSAGGSGPHNNVPPYISINFIIKY